MYCYKIFTKMSYVLIIHEVADFKIWKRIFDEATDIRKAAGEIRYQILKDSHESNKIVHFSAWTSLEKAKEFFESNELVEIRIKAGVISPEFMYLSLLERNTL